MRRAMVAGCLVLACALSGCASARESIDDALDQGVAATATASLALQQDVDGRTLRSAARTTVEDARRELVDAAGTVGETDAATPVEAGRRAEALDALDAAIAAVGTAADALGGVAGASVAQAADRVADAEANLRDLTRDGRP